MSIVYPTSLDTFTNPTATSKTDSPSLAGQQSDQNDSIEALEAKVGITGSAVTSSLDYKVTNTSSSNPGHKHTLANGATDVTATAENVNILASTTVTATELNYVHGVTSAIQAQLNTKATVSLPVSVSNGGTGATTLTGIVKASGTSAMTAVTAPSGTIVGTSDSQIFTNKTLIATTNVISESTSTASSATPTPTGGSLKNDFQVTALATGATFGAPTGTPVNGNTLLVRVKDNGTSRTVAFNAIYRFSSDLSAPTATVLGKSLYMGFVYNSADSKWDNLFVLGNFT